jgi:hypothetical protein
LASLPDVDVYIVSHKLKRNIPAFVFELFPEDQILIRSNIGYDWGCYQQFINSGYWKNYERIFFMHDDVQIHDFGFIDQVSVKLKNHHVIGNGRGEGSVGQSSIRNHPYAYAHSTWIPDSFDFTHPTVRGSFFAITSQDLDRLDGFEVYWDPFKIFIGFGNWSTKATCGRMADRFGIGCFGYLSETFGCSDHITEFIRGEQNGVLTQPEGLRGWFYSTIKRFSRVYFEIKYLEKRVFPRPIWLAALKLAINAFSSKLY